MTRRGCPVWLGCWSVVVTALFLAPACTDPVSSNPGAAISTKPPEQRQEAAAKAPALRTSLIRMTDVTAVSIPVEARGSGELKDPFGMRGAAAAFGGGVAVVDWDGGGGPDLVFTPPGLGRPWVLLNDKASFTRTPSPGGPVPPRCTGMVVFGVGEDTEVIVSGLGHPVAWRPPGKAELQPGKQLTIRGALGVPWSVGGVDLQAIGVSGSLLMFSGMLPDTPIGCYDRNGKDAMCDVKTIRPGAVVLGPQRARPKKTRDKYPTWPGFPMTAITSAFAFGDLPAFFVSDINGPDRVYLLPRDTAIEDAAFRLGVASSITRGWHATHGADLGDVDGNGTVDLVVATASDGVLLYLSDEDGQYTDRSMPTKLFALSAGKAWYGVLLADLDLDGDADLVATGDEGLGVFEFDGGIFTRVPAPDLPPSRGAALLDLDADGDLDLAVAVKGGGLRLIRNDVTTADWLRVLQPVLEGVGTPYAGTRLSVQWADGRKQVAEARRVRGFNSSSQLPVRFARRAPIPAGEPMLTVRAPGGAELQVPWPEKLPLTGAPVDVPAPPL